MSYLVAATLLTACAEADPTAPVPQLQRLLAAESAWRDAKLTDYSFVGSVSCFCPNTGRSVLVTVRNGFASVLTDRLTGEQVPRGQLVPVDELFELIRREVRDLPSRLEVSYDPRLGYPRRISFGRQELDGGGVIVIENLRPLP